jgi:hypothetical protein
MEYSGLQEFTRQRLEALVALLGREIVLAEEYPETQARLIARRIRAQVALEELSHPFIATETATD